MYRKSLAAALAAVVGSALLATSPALANGQLLAQVSQQVVKLGLHPAVLANANPGQIAQIEDVLNDSSESHPDKAERIKMILQ